jgi:hypothetical protein
MIRAVAFTASLLAAGTAFAWNKAGHMVSGAIAYRELQRSDPAALAQVVVLLRQNPEYETRWKSVLDQPYLPANEKDLCLFMLAARWADDVRGEREFDHPSWHYIDYPYKPMGQPASVRTFPPDAENAVAAIQTNLKILKSGASPAQKAVALSWIFHLIGDEHMPLHDITLFSSQYDTPEGDRGGTRFYISPKEDAQTMSLHSFWDDLILRSERYQSVRNRAIELAARPEFQRNRLPELSKYKTFKEWAKPETYDLAVIWAYLNGKLKGSQDKEDGPTLPAGYAQKAKAVAERQIVLAGYRLADTLKALF